MPTNSQLSLESELQPHQDNKSMVKDGDPVATQLASNDVEPQQQPPVKKPTRQWAAWTRQEEERFFTALRHVGKNFEKITRQVQSKNKDQVRHYYYRLVRRMNKLLDSGLYLDAKNSKDTTAAMLRWWSLLEKYSCKASKLHLKPRRFKIFVEALEHQLLKDKKKNVRKRCHIGEKCSPVGPTAVTSQSRQDSQAVKLVLADSQNSQKIGTGKGLFKRNVNAGGYRSANKGDTAALKPNRQKRKKGVVSSSAYKKWEKAAIAGVSLVADAAEQLERTGTDKEVEHEQCEPVQKGLDPVGALPDTIANTQFPLVENSVHNSMKLKLQLFPIDDSTRRALEIDKHNPHLELTLSMRKRLSSVLERLNRKWGDSGAASGTLMLFPYNAQRENLMVCQSWTQDSIVSAADVHAMVGSPPVFRLRYGWFSNNQFGSATSQAPLGSLCIPCGHGSYVENMERLSVDLLPASRPLNNNHLEKLVEDQQVAISDNCVCAPPSQHDVYDNRCISTDSRNMLLGSSDSSYDLVFKNKAGQSAGEWADSLTNISVGDLLSELPLDMDVEGIEQPVDRRFQQMPFNGDSFDAAIAAHISRHHNKMNFGSITESHSPSIWDAEETCDAFSFQKNHALSQGAAITKHPTAGVSDGLTENSHEVQPIDRPCDGDQMEECPPDAEDIDNSEKDFTTLTDVYWPESLGPLDLDISPSKYHNEDIILSDSVSGLNRLIANSLDAFQNCSFFSLGKKEQPSTIETRESATLADFKVGSGVQS